MAAAQTQRLDRTWRNLHHRRDLVQCDRRGVLAPVTPMTQFEEDQNALNLAQQVLGELFPQRAVIVIASTPTGYCMTSNLVGEDLNYMLQTILDDIADEVPDGPLN